MTLNWTDKQTGDQLTANEVNLIVSEVTSVGSFSDFKSGLNTSQENEVIDLFLYMGQSNNGGSGDVSTLESDSLEIIGKDLSTTQQNVLFSLSHHETDNIHDTPRLDGTFENITPGITSSNPTSYGAEISFADIYKNLSSKSTIAIKKYYVNGATIEYFDKDLSETDGVPTGNYGSDFRDTGPKNCWDHIKEIIADINAQETSLGVTFNIVGFIWWQGTSDISTLTYPGTTQTRAEAYENNLTRLIENIRSLLGKPNLPVGVIMPHDDRDTTDAASRTTLQNGVTNVVSALDNISLIDPVDYKNTGQAGYFDEIHWGGKGHLEIGRLMAKEMYNLVEGYTPNQSILYNVGNALEQTLTTVVVNKYLRQDLPLGPIDGTLALVTDSNVGMVYSKDGEWYRITDNTLVVRTDYTLDPDGILSNGDPIIILQDFSKWDGSVNVPYVTGDIVESTNVDQGVKVLIRKEGYSWTHVFWEQKGIEWEKVILQQP